MLYTLRNQWNRGSHVFPFSKTKNVFACRFATSCAFYGLTLNVANVGGNIYINTLIMGAVVIPLYPLMIYLSNKLGRRNLISWSFILAGLFCASMYFIPRGMILFLLTWSINNSGMYVHQKWLALSSWNELYIKLGEPQLWSKAIYTSGRPWPIFTELKNAIKCYIQFMLV